MSSQRKRDDQRYTISHEHGNSTENTDSKRKVFELVRYLLCQDRRKIPIKKQDINKNILKEQARSFQAIFEEARICLKHIFGIDVIECELSGKTKVYLLKNGLDIGHENISSEQSTVKDYSLLMIILSLIYMSSGVLGDDQLKRAFKQLGIPKDLQMDDVSRTVQRFVKQGYIVRERIPRAEAPTFQYKLGIRSLTETSKREILQFISEMYGVEIHQWKMQYKEILSEEEISSK